MRLTAIKLAGFKSFVDPTHLRLSSNLTGIVGPNGCGKSNVIDAVRWVTGESSAKQLRGEALEDVIFNGSKARKPIGRASIELLFDNAEGKLGGQYASFSEISIRRELARDGASQYYINGARSRRRDVIDLFLGTGLGGRSNYAVIEQGAVNRLIEAKPEDMRQVLEEAAGISKYKERRRETENRIRHTRENLDRLNDLIGEVSQRLAQLQRQAANAEKYKQYKAEERRLRAQLLALRWLALNQEYERQEANLAERRRALESAQTRAREVGERREGQRKEQQEAAHECQRLQADFYAAEAEVARVEQSLAHARELRRVREAEAQDIERALTELNERIESENNNRENLRQTIAQQTRALEDCDREVAASRQHLDEAQRGVREGEAAWDAINSDEGNPLQQAETERTRLEHLEQNLASAGERLERLLGERQRLDGEAPQQALTEAESALSRLAQEMEGVRADYDTVESELARLRESRSEHDGKLDETRQALAGTRGRLSSQEALQQAALREDDADLQTWLSEQGWDDATRVAHVVRVANGWESAAEAALGGFLRALSVPDLAGRMERLGAWPEQALTLLADQDEHAGHAAEPGPPGSRSLTSVLEGPPALQRVAQRIFLVEDETAARGLLARLQNGQMLVTRSGVCFGPEWVRIPRSGDDQEGLLRREQNIERLRGELEKLSTDEQDREAALSDLRQRLSQAETRRGELATRLDDLRKRHGEQLAERQGLNVRLEQQQRRRRELDSEIEELRARKDEHESAIGESRARLEAVSGAARDHVQRRQSAQQRLQGLREELDAARGKRDAVADQRQKLQLELASRRSALESAEQRSRELEERRERHLQRRAELRQEPEANRDADAKAQASREQMQARRDEARRSLGQARERLNEIEGRAEDFARDAQAAEQAVEAAREAMQQVRMSLETASVRRQTLEEQLAEAGHAPKTVVEQLPEQASTSAWEQQIEAMERRIQRLGAINLAAIEEFDAEKEREEYLQGQHQDLTDALGNLESAIAKIDRETRSRFRDTYEKVNERMGALFPVLFGGGEARLELTEDDLLATGVRVIARPPGKRNASIQMLSGGEKALTAVALLFALFELNPAPFCMLDEIDAPLDDANVSRFCDLVRAMSEQVQFIVITHNKLTMELVNQLHGVTMAEPGVSRLVSVDIDSALEMAS